MSKEMTIQDLDQILYALTYENGLTFGLCGNADESSKQGLVRLINQFFQEGK